MTKNPEIGISKGSSDPKSGTAKGHLLQISWSKKGNLKNDIFILFTICCHH